MTLNNEYFHAFSNDLDDRVKRYGILKCVENDVECRQRVVPLARLQLNAYDL